MKQEIEQLRSIESSYQSMASEKSALQRQLSSVELDLENEKRVLARMRNKEQSEGESGANYKAQLEKLNKELIKERKDRENVEKNARAEAKEWARQRELMESQLSESKIKASKSKNRFENTSRQISRNISSFDGAGSERDADKPRNRNATNFKSDLTIATPGAVNASKKAQRLPTQPGHKSTFSITPLINRFGAPSSSSDSDDESGDGNEDTNTSGHKNVQQHAKRKDLGDFTSSDRDPSPQVSKPTDLRKERLTTSKSLNQPSTFQHRTGKKSENEKKTIFDEPVTNVKSTTSTAQRGTGKRQRVLGKRNNNPFL